MSPLRSAAILISLLSACYTVVESVYAQSVFDFERPRPYHPLVQQFASRFADRIVSSKYYNAFSAKHLSIDQFTEIIKKIVLDPHVAIGSADPEFLAISASQAARVNFDVVTPLYAVEVFAFTAGEHLFQRFVLNSDNVEKISKQYLKSITRELVNLDDFSDALTNFSAIRDGLVNFIASYGFFTKDNAFALAGTFTQVWHANRL